MHHLQNVSLNNSLQCTHVAAGLPKDSDSSPTASYMKPRCRRIHPTIQNVVKMLESVRHPYCTIHPYCTAQHLYEDPGTIIVSDGIPTQTSSTADQNDQEEQEMVFEPVQPSRTAVLQLEDMARTQSSLVEEAHAIVHKLSTE